MPERGPRTGEPLSWRVVRRLDLEITEKETLRLEVQSQTCTSTASTREIDGSNEVAGTPRIRPVGFQQSRCRRSTGWKFLSSMYSRQQLAATVSATYQAEQEPQRNNFLHPGQLQQQQPGQHEPVWWPWLLDTWHCNHWYEECPRGGGSHDWMQAR